MWGNHFSHSKPRRGAIAPTITRSSGACRHADWTTIAAAMPSTDDGVTFHGQYGTGEVDHDRRAGEVRRTGERRRRIVSQMCQATWLEPDLEAGRDDAETEPHMQAIGCGAGLRPQIGGDVFGSAGEIGEVGTGAHASASLGGAHRLGVSATRGQHRSERGQLARWLRRP